MVTAALLLALALASAPPEVDASSHAVTSTTSGVTLGVVRLARGPVTLEVESGDAPLSAATGALFGAGASVDTRQGGWAELLVIGVGRVRLSASTRVVLEQGSLRVVSGRVWIQRTDGDRGYVVELPDGACRVERGSSVLIEHAARVGSTLVVRAGHATFTASSDEAHPVQVGAGELSTLALGAKHPALARTGGVGLADLADVEAKSVLGDIGGVRRFLLDRIATTAVARTRPRRTVIRTVPEVSGGDPVSATLESAVRPAPFFETEVPPKGPNVKVEVSFGE